MNSSLLSCNKYFMLQRTQFQKPPLCSVTTGLWLHLWCCLKWAFKSLHLSSKISFSIFQTGTNKSHPGAVFKMLLCFGWGGVEVYLFFKVHGYHVDSLLSESRSIRSLDHTKNSYLPYSNYASSRCIVYILFTWIPLLVCMCPMHATWGYFGTEGSIAAVLMT